MSSEEIGNCHWGEEDDSRRVEGTELVIDKKYWQMLGSPHTLLIGIANEAGWDRWVKKDANKSAPAQSKQKRA